MGKLKLHWQIAIALVLAVILGALTGTDGELFGLRFVVVYEFIGTLFLNALTMLIVPLVVAAIITGIASVGDSLGLGRLGSKTVVYYLASSLLAILIGLLFVNLIAPGVVDGRPAGEVFGLEAAEAQGASIELEETGMGALAQVFLDMIPPNVVAAAAEGQLLGLIVFSLLFGYFMMRIGEPHGRLLGDFWQAVFAVMMRITDLVMKFAPLGVFGLVAGVVAGLEAENLGATAQSLGLFFLSVVLALAVHVLFVLPLVLRFVAGVSPVRHYRAVAPALLTAFSTASSAATLPLTMECVEKNAGVSNRTSSFVLPLGATVNMDGTALYECVAAMFIAQAYGIELGFATQFTIVLVALVTSIGVAGIPAASLVAITIILTTIGLPLEAIGLILAVDRVLDMFRTSVNVFSDTVGAVIVARSEGEQGVLQASPASDETGARV